MSENDLKIKYFSLMGFLALVFLAGLWSYRASFFEIYDRAVAKVGALNAEHKDK